MKTGWYVIHEMDSGNSRVVKTLENVTFGQAVVAARHYMRATGAAAFIRPLNRPALYVGRVRG